MHTSKIAEKIAAIPAETLAGLRIKGRTMKRLWLPDDYRLDGEEDRVLSSLMKDLWRDA